MSANPVLVDVYRGALVESRHRGAIALSDAGGKLVFALGDVDRPVFPRSAVKLIQALPLVESGAADAYGFSNQQLALACASHNGEALHTATAASMLARAGRSEADLECGAHWPGREADRGRLHVNGLQPGALHNNCSGKHSGFVCFACHAGYELKGYVGADHPVQRDVTAALAEVTRTKLGPEVAGTDGCAIPTYAIPLKNIAAGFARLATGEGVSPARAKAAQRLIQAVLAEPFMVAGTDRFCTDFMTALGTRAFVKTGAEGVFAGLIPSLGLGFTIKCDDGAARAAEIACAALIGALLKLDDAILPRRFLEPVLNNWNGSPVSQSKPSAELNQALKAAFAG